MLEVWLALTSVKYLDNVLVLILLNQWLKLTMLWATQPRSLTSCFDLNAGFTRANVVVFGQSVLYWKVSVLRTETAKIVTHLNGFLQTEKVINFFSTSNFSYFETSCCSEKPNKPYFSRNRINLFCLTLIDIQRNVVWKKSQKLRWKAFTYTCKYYKTFSKKDKG